MAQRADIRQRIDSFASWHYEFCLDGETTPIRQRSYVNRHQQRRRYFFEPLVDLCGGSLAGKRVLDVGCNAGFWSYQAIEAGCDYVYGIDARPMHIEQAELVFDINDVDPRRYDFRVADVLDVRADVLGRFDIVLCLGLMYHVRDPIGLIETISDLNSDLLVIDTELSLLPGPYLRIKRDHADNPVHAAEGGLVLAPTRAAVVAMAQATGYSIRILAPHFSDFTGCERYFIGARRAFLASKQTPLDDLAADIEPVGSARSVGEVARSARATTRLARRKIKRRFRLAL